MQRNAMNVMARLIISVWFISIGLVVFASTGVCAAQTNAADGVVLVHLQYADGQWRLGKDGVRILPCDPPNEFKRGSARDPLFRVMGDDGKLMHERIIMNPRLVLYEDREKKAELLEKVSFNLRFAYREGMRVFEFYPTADVKDGQAKPAVKTDMGQAVKRLDEMRKSGGRLPCQQPPLK
jgi:hypothetical protein